MVWSFETLLLSKSRARTTIRWKQIYKALHIEVDLIQHLTDLLLIEVEIMITEETDGCTSIQVTGYGKVQLILKGSPGGGGRYPSTWFMIITGSTNPNIGNNNFEIYNWPNYTPRETNRLSTVRGETNDPTTNSCVAVVIQSDGTIHSAYNMRFWSKFRLSLSR